MNRASLLAFLTFCGSCLQAGSFACDGNASCVLDGVEGVCQPEGFCSFPDDACDGSGQRWHEYAGDGLAGTCVEPSSGSTGPIGDEGSSGPIATETDATTANDDSADTSTTSGGPLECVDGDGDGYGDGEGCVGPDAFPEDPDLVFEVFLSPGGDDAGDGGETEPWLSFGHALGQLQPGWALTLLDGDYPVGAHGSLDVECRAGEQPPLPITVRARESRRARLIGGGAGPALRIAGCSRWRVEGLVVEGQAELHDAAGVILRGALIVGPASPTRGEALLDIAGSTETQVEDVELYQFGVGARVFASEGTELRRVYAHPRAGGSGDAVGIEVQADDASTIENCVVEGTASAGIVVGTGVGTRVLGSMVHGPLTGLLFEGKARDVEVRNVVLVDGANNGLWGMGVDDVSIDAVSVFSNLATGFHLTDAGTVDMRRSLGLRNGLFGFVTNTSGTQTFADCNMWAEGEALPPGFEEELLSLDVPDMGPEQGQCLVYVPESSPMKGAAEDGTDIGANIIVRSVHGEEDGVALWSASGFPCGAQVTGINDLAGESCFDLHTRFNVGSNGCPLPP